MKLTELEIGKKYYMCDGCGEDLEAIVVRDIDKDAETVCFSYVSEAKLNELRRKEEAKIKLFSAEFPNLKTKPVSDPATMLFQACCDAHFFESEEQYKAERQSIVNSIYVCEDVSGTGVAIYKGFPTIGMTHIPNNKLDWHVEKEEGCAYLTLDEIRRQVVEKGLADEKDSLTVFEESPLDGDIFVCGNYCKGDWSRRGKLNGYA